MFSEIVLKVPDQKRKTQLIIQMYVKNVEHACLSLRFYSHLIHINMSKTDVALRFLAKKPIIIGIFHRFWALTYDVFLRLLM